MTTVIMNPGTGALAGATLRRAWKVARALRRAVGCGPAPTRLQRADDDEGRYGFLINGHEVQVPGVSLRRVRKRDLFQPRIYVDGGSWYWRFAVESCQEEP